MVDITLRPATISDLPILKYWDKQPHVMFATGADAYVEDDWMEEQLTNPSKYVWIYIAELEGRSIGVIQIIDPANEETHYWGEVEQGLRAIDIWIGETDDLGKGYGTQMMNQAIDLCFADPAIHAIVIDPLAINTRAHTFYERLGFVFVREQTFGEDHCRVYRLERSS
jgi:aminoglycoside 6'-N-acetyltransferase